MRSIIAVLAIALVTSTAAYAEDVTFQIQSFHPNRVQVKFWSDTRGHVWPSLSEAYNLNDYDVHRYELTCIRGETICYGAWVTGDASIYWGRGIAGDRPCTACCTVCNGGTTVVKQLTVR